MNGCVNLVTSLLLDFGIDVEPDEVSGIFSWCFQGNAYPVTLTFDSGGEQLMLRIGPVADLTKEEPATAYRLLDSFMEANQWLPEGRYAGNEQVYFEVPVWLNGDCSDFRNVISGLMVYADMKPLIGLGNTNQAPRPSVEETASP